MTHDPLCPYRPDVAVDYGEWIKGKPCYCDLIVKVRHDAVERYLEERRRVVLAEMEG